MNPSIFKKSKKYLFEPLAKLQSVNEKSTSYMRTITRQLFIVKLLSFASLSIDWLNKIDRH
jgi:hypothetical protein